MLKFVAIFLVGQGNLEQISVIYEDESGERYILKKETPDGIWSFSGKVEAEEFKSKCFSEASSLARRTLQKWKGSRLKI